ncbi:hypothetical protein [Acinetobacter baumannii]
MKLIFYVVLLALATNVHAELTPLQKLVLTDDFEAWLDGNKSVFNWSTFRKKEIEVNNSFSSPSIIYTEFVNNIFKAENTYGGKIQGIYSPFNSITKNDFGEPVIVFDVGSFNHLYVNGPSIKEVQNLKIGAPIKLLCIGFKLDKVNDMSATCSFFSNPSTFIAVNNIQHESSQETLNRVVKVSQNIFGNLESKFTKSAITDINKNCDVLDSTNYSYCKVLLRNGLRESKEN